jgi:asparagine synthase (glutamine-hydrolysing)
VIASGLGELAPKALRIRIAEGAYRRNYGAQWLDADIRQHYLHDAATLSASEPLRPSDWFGYYLARPSVKVGHEALRSFSGELGLRWEAPLVDPEFLGSLSGSLRWHDYRGRRHLLRTLFADLLPKAIIDRRGKIAFNTALFGPYTREFAAEWDGRGTPAGVNGEWLKNHWQSSEVSAGTAPLLHHVWLAAQETRRLEDGARCQ